MFGVKSPARNLNAAAIQMEFTARLKRSRNFNENHLRGMEPKRWILSSLPECVLASRLCVRSKQLFNGALFVFPAIHWRVECLENTRLLRPIRTMTDLCSRRKNFNLPGDSCVCVRARKWDFCRETFYMRTQSSPNNLLTKPHTSWSAKQKKKVVFADKLLNAFGFSSRNMRATRISNDNSSNPYFFLSYLL